MFEKIFISKFKNCRLHRAEVHRVLWKIKEYVYFCGSVQPISLRTMTMAMTMLEQWFQTGVPRGGAWGAY